MAGPIVHLKLGFEEIVVLNKASDAAELVSHFATLQYSIPPNCLPRHVIAQSKVKKLFVAKAPKYTQENI